MRSSPSVAKSAPFSQEQEDEEAAVREALFADSTLPIPASSNDSVPQSVPIDLSVPFQFGVVENQQIPRATCSDPTICNLKQPTASGTATAGADAAADAGADDLNNLNRLSESKLTATTSDLSSAEDEGHHSASEAGSERSSSRESSASRTSPARSIPPMAIDLTQQLATPSTSAPLSPLVEDSRTLEKESAATACHSAGESGSGGIDERVVKELIGSLSDNKGDVGGLSELMNSLGGEPTPVAYLPNIMPADANANSALNYESAETNSENVSEAGAIAGNLHSARISATSSPVELSSPEDQQAGAEEQMVPRADSFRALAASSSSTALSLQQRVPSPPPAPPKHKHKPKPLAPFACKLATTASDSFAQECDLEKDLQIRADAIRLAMEPLAPLDTCCSASPIAQHANSDRSSSPGCSKGGRSARNSRKGKPRTAQRLAEEEVHASLEDVLRQFVSLEALSGTISLFATLYIIFNCYFTSVLYNRLVLYSLRSIKLIHLI